jgi:hypothetical protein
MESRTVPVCSYGTYGENKMEERRESNEAAAEKSANISCSADLFS